MVAGRNVNAQGGREARIRAFAAEHRARLAAERTGIDAPVLHGLGSSDAAEAEGEGGEELASPVASPMAAGRAAAPSPLPGERGTCRQIGMLLCSPLYVLLTLALCFLYFVVTGIQFWITDYLHEVVGEPKEKVLTAFAITSCTGPALGVVFGGWLVDRMGGYKDESGEAVCTALKVCAWFCIGAFAAAVPAALIEHFSAPPNCCPRTSERRASSSGAAHCSVCCSVVRRQYLVRALLRGRAAPLRDGRLHERRRPIAALHGFLLLHVRLQPAGIRLRAVYLRAGRG